MKLEHFKHALESHKVKPQKRVASSQKTSKICIFRGVKIIKCVKVDQFFKVIDPGSPKEQLAQGGFFLQILPQS